MAAKSKLYMLDDYIVLDLETTGHYPGIDEIIEIGAIRVIENEMIESFQTFVKCEFIPPDIMELTGITPENLENAASPDIAISALEDFIGNSTIIGHNLSFDLTFLKYYGSKYTSDSIEWIDTLRLSRKMISSDHGHGLTTLCALAGINRDIKHRSIADCKSTHELYQYLKKTAIESGKTFEDYFKKNIAIGFNKKSIYDLSHQKQKNSMKHTPFMEKSSSSRAILTVYLALRRHNVSSTSEVLAGTM